MSQRRVRSTRRGLKRSYPCNVDLLAFLRERKGWTQQELAAASGYSERLVNKAESGRPISTSAIETLADALSTDGDPVYLEDLVCDVVALAKEYIAALYVHQAQIVDNIRHFLDDDVVFRVSGDPAVVPFAGEFRGIAEVERGFGVMFSVLEAPRDHDYAACYSYLAKGKEVIVWGDSWLHPIGRPLKEPMKISNRLTFQKGKLVLFEDVFDTLHAARALTDGP